MSEPSTAIAALVQGVIVILGVATGLRPELLLSAAAGGWWAMSYQPELKPLSRINRIGIAALVGAWGAPWVVHLIRGADVADIVQFPVALVLGLASVDVLGGGLLALVKRWIGGLKRHD